MLRIRLRMCQGAVPDGPGWTALEVLANPIQPKHSRKAVIEIAQKFQAASYLMQEHQWSYKS